MDSENNWSLKNVRKPYLTIILAASVAPILISIFISIQALPWIVVNNDWIGFWGSYAGAIIGGIITLLVMQRTLYINERMQEKQRKQEMSNHIAELVSAFCSEMMAYRSKWNTLYRKSNGKEIDPIQKIELGATTEAPRRLYFEIDILAGDIPEAQNLLKEIKEVLNGKITEKSVNDTEEIMNHLRELTRTFSKAYLSI